MKQFFRGGRELPNRQGDHVINLTSYQDLSSRPKEEKIKYPLSNCRPSDNSEQVFHYGSRKIGTQRGDVGRVWCMQLAKGYQLLALIIFCVLFSTALVTPAYGQEADGRSKNALKSSLGKGFVIGDTLPEAFWLQRLKVFNHPNRLSEIELSDYRDKLLVLDFWATYCGPCVASLEKWNTLQQEYGDRVQVLAIHLYDRSSKALPFIEKRGWQHTLSTGNYTDTLLNRMFYVQPCYGQVWISKGKVVAMPVNNRFNISGDNIEEGIEGMIPHMQMMESYIYRRDGYGQQ